jgi:hypothetical protein
MGRRLIVAVADPVLRSAASAELIESFDLVQGHGYAHSLALLATCGDLDGVVVQDRGWDRLGGGDLLVEARRRRPAVGRTVLVPLLGGGGARHDAVAHAICWTPWEPGELAAAVRRASLAAAGPEARPPQPSGQR